MEPGTSALVLDVTDKLPLHGRVDLDNFSPPGTPELRINANLSYANLWQLDHSWASKDGFSPEETKPSLGIGHHVSLNPMDAPEISYYSGFYRAPFGAPVAAEDQKAQDPNHFGYNETTKHLSAASEHRALRVHGLRLPLHHPRPTMYRTRLNA